MKPVPAGMGAVNVSVPIGLDFGAILAFAAARGTDLDLLADVLPTVERAMLAGLDEEAD